MAQPTIPGYSIVDRLGSGGFATVYLATKDDGGGNVAIKVLHDHTNNPADLLRFEREQTTMHALNGHPNIVAILNSGTTDDERHFTVLEYVDGGSVRDRITGGGALHWANVVEIGVQICAALDIAHRSGVLHRDVKPANILLEDNTAKLSDFGIARLIGQSQVTAAQSIIGTLAYTPPEVFHNRPFDGRGDIYQLGISLYEMLLGRAPFTSAAADNKATIIRRILDHPAPPLAQFDVPQPLSDLLDEVLAKDPADRPQAAESFGRRLNQVEAALGRTPTVIGNETQPLSMETEAPQRTATVSGNGGGGAQPGEHQSLWPRTSEEHGLGQHGVEGQGVDQPTSPDTVQTSAPGPDALPIRPVDPAAVANQATVPDVAVAPDGPLAPEAPVAPEVEPRVDANITVVEPRPVGETSILHKGGAPMSLGTPGPAPAHFDAPAAATASRPTPQDISPSRRRWPWALLIVALLGAGGAGVAVAQFANNNNADPVGTDDGETDSDVPARTPQLAALAEPAFLQPEAQHGVIFDVVRNQSGLTMVGSAGDGESADAQRPVVWTLDSTEIQMQREFDQGGRIWSIGVSSDDFLAVGDTAEGQGATDGIAVIGDRVGNLTETSTDTFTGPANDVLRASEFDPSADPSGFLVGGSRSSSDAATMGLWSVARPRAGEPAEWLAIPIGTGNEGTINGIAATSEFAVAVGSEQIDGATRGVIFIRRGDGNWSSLIEPLPGTTFEAVAIAGDRIIAVGQQAGVPIAIVSRADGQQPWLHKLPIRATEGVARDVAEVLDGRVVVVGDTLDPNDSNNRTGTIWELLPNADFQGDNWTTRASADLPTSFTELRAIDEFEATVYIFGRTEVDGRRPAGAWTLDLDA